MRCLRCQGRCQRRDSISLRIETAMPASLEQRKDLDDVDAACEHADGVAVRGEKPVVLLQREDSSDLGSLLSLAGCEDPEGALPGQVDRLAGDSPAERHQAIQASQAPLLAAGR